MRRGLAWEFALERWHKDYRRDGKASVVKCHPGAKVVGGRLIYDSVGPPDFMGCLAGGRVLIFEAKEVATPTFPFKNLETHQALGLAAVHRLGGLAFVAVQQMSGDAMVRQVILPWETLGPAWMDWYAGAKPASVRLDEALPMDAEGWLGPLVG